MANAYYLVNDMAVFIFKHGVKARCITPTVNGNIIECKKGSYSGATPVPKSDPVLKSNLDFYKDVLDERCPWKDKKQAVELLREKFIHDKEEESNEDIEKEAKKKYPEEI